MSDLFSRIYDGTVKTFEAAEAEAESIWAKVESIPGVKAIEDAAKSEFKQQLSNAFAFIDTNLKPHYSDAVSMVESGFDTGMLGIVGGVAPAAVPIAQRTIPMLNAGIEMLANQMRAAIDHAEAEAKVAWNLAPPPVTAQVAVPQQQAA